MLKFKRRNVKISGKFIKFGARCRKNIIKFLCNCYQIKKICSIKMN